jgi:hypothetical protein
MGELFALVISVHCFDYSSWPMRPRLEGWPSTAARLAGWRRVTRQVWFCTCDGGDSLPFPYRTGCPNRGCSAASWWNFQLLLYSKCTVNNQPSWATSRKEGMAWYSSRPMSLMMTNDLKNFRLGQRSSILIRSEKWVENLANWPWHFVLVNLYSELKYSNSHWSSYLK